MKTVLSVLVVFVLFTLGFPDTSLESRVIATTIVAFGSFLLGQHGIVVGGLSLLGLYTLLK